LGILAPTAWNLAGSERNSLISWSSSTASSAPATSLNVVLRTLALSLVSMKKKSAPIEERQAFRPVSGFRPSEDDDEESREDPEDGTTQESRSLHATPVS
jgi:hypothetical protein